MAAHELYQQITTTAARAAAHGQLLPIASRVVHVDDAGVRWVVRVVESLRQKPGTRHPAPGRSALSTAAPPTARPSPWLPPEPDLTVAELTPTHRLVLNKFPVIAGHTLVVTRSYEDQDEPLDRRDFEALNLVRATWPQPGTLGFYNGGHLSGASQRHKHLQVVPLPLAEGDEQPLPADPLAGPLPFNHAAGPLTGRETADELAALVSELGRALGLSPGASYNLLLAPQWMMVVPRSAERFEGISVNSLGFAGCLLARDEDELALIRRVGPASILRALT